MKRNLKILITALFAIVIANITACKKLSSFDYPPESITTYQMIKGDNTFTIFTYAVDRANLKSLLDGQEKITVLLPSNATFLASGYPTSAIAAMPISDVATLVKNHIITGSVDTRNLAPSEEKTTLSNQKVLIQRVGNNSYVDGADITNPNQKMSNGYVQIINKVIVTQPTMLNAINLYSNATTKSQFTYAIAALERASTGTTNFMDLLYDATPYTFFLPNNGAWIDGGYATLAAVNAASPAVLENILKNHFIAGAKFTTQIDSTAIIALNGNKIYFDKGKPDRTTNSYANGILFGNGVASNIKANNGIIHTVARFIPAPIATNTLDRIQSDANLTLFAAMLKKASEANPAVNYETLLSDPLRSYTVFAVKNTGIIAAGFANIAAINAANPNIIADIVKFHLVFRRANNINYAENASAPTLLKGLNIAGKETSTSILFLINGGFKVKGRSNVTTINVETGNIITTNGLLNIIGSVLEP